MIVLDHRIRQELLGCVPEPRLDTGTIAIGDFDVEHLALAHARHAGNAERGERAFDRLALGIENPGFEGHRDAGLHRALLDPSITANRRRPNRYRKAPVASLEATPSACAASVQRSGKKPIESVRRLRDLTQPGVA